MPPNLQDIQCQALQRGLLRPNSAAAHLMALQQLAGPEAYDLLIILQHVRWVGRRLSRPVESRTHNPRHILVVNGHGNASPQTGPRLLMIVNRHLQHP